VSPGWRCHSSEEIFWYYTSFYLDFKNHSRHSFLIEKFLKKEYFISSPQNRDKSRFVQMRAENLIFYYMSFMWGFELKSCEKMFGNDKNCV
jgi:hypothetical protein